MTETHKPAQRRQYNVIAGNISRQTKMILQSIVLFSPARSSKVCPAALAA